MSSHMLWMVVRNNSSFLVKKRNIKKHFSTDPLNMKNIHSPRFCGLVQKKAIMIEPHSSNNGINLVYKKKKHYRRPADHLERVQLTRTASRTMRVIKNFIKTHRYRKDLRMLAIRRATAVIKSQRPILPKKKAFKKKSE